MRILKTILIIVLVIIGIPLVVALFVRKDFHTEREIVIDRPVSQVYEYVKYVENQDNFGKWQLSDPDATLVASGTDGTVGFTYSWDGKKVGKGSQTIMGLVPNEKVETELDFGFGEPARSFILTEEVGPNQTKVTWGLAGKSPYPFNFMGLFFDMGDDFSEGLQNLKTILENEELADDRAFLLNYYDETLAKLQTAIAGLNADQMHFKPSPDAWSVSQCLEHIVLTENMIFGMVKENMAKPANSERRPEIQLEDSEIVSMIVDRSQKHSAPEMLLPRGKYDDPDTGLRELTQQRAAIVSYVRDVSTEDLRNHVADSPSGASDAYQSLLFLAGHTARHTMQIEEIKANANFPK